MVPEITSSGLVLTTPSSMSSIRTRELVEFMGYVIRGVSATRSCDVFSEISADIRSPFSLNVSFYQRESDRMRSHYNYYVSIIM